MQHFSGGWTYWEGSYEADPHITPYVLRSLFVFEELGEKIPKEVFDNGVNYIIANEAEYIHNPDSYAEAVWTLAVLRDSRALLWWTRIDPSKLSRHGYIAYAFAAKKLGKYTRNMGMIITEKLEKNEESWYWSTRADIALYAQILLEEKNTLEAFRIIESLVRDIDLSSYYVSTQEKIQILRALIIYMKDQPKMTSSFPMALR